MALRDELLKNYPEQKFRPGIYGGRFRPAPKPDAFGRTPATPARIQRVLDGFDPFPELTPTEEYPKRYQDRQRRPKKHR